MTSTSDFDDVVARRLVVRSKVWAEIQQVAEETGLSTVEVMERALEAGMPAAQRYPEWR